MMAKKEDPFASYTVDLDEPIDVTKLKGVGSFGAVYEVKFRGCTCVLKRLLDILTGVRGQEFVSPQQYRPLLEKFRQECDLLSKMRHPNVVQFLGIYRGSPDPRDLSLIMEKLFIDLDNFIKTYKNVPLCVKLNILHNVSSGLVYMHSLGVMHRDLNAGNVLLTDDLKAKVADLGMSRAFNTNRQYAFSVVPGALDYMPPEAQTGNYGIKIDSFSFGHLALYLLVEVYPHLEVVTMKSLRNSLDQYASIEMLKRREWLSKLEPDHCIHPLLTSCLQDEPKERGPMTDINSSLLTLCTQYPRTMEDVMTVLKAKGTQGILI